MMSKILLCAWSRRALRSSRRSVHALLLICRWYCPHCKCEDGLTKVIYMKPHSRSSSPQPPLMRPSYLPGPHSTHDVVFFWNIQHVTISPKTSLESSSFNRQNTRSGNYHWWNFHNQGHRLVLFIIEGVQFVFPFCKNKWNKRKADDLESIGIHSLDPRSPSSNL